MTTHPVASGLYRPIKESLYKSIILSFFFFFYCLNVILYTKMGVQQHTTVIQFYAVEIVLGVFNRG